MDPLEVGADGCELNGSGDAKAGNLTIGGGSMAAEVSISRMVLRRAGTSLREGATIVSTTPPVVIQKLKLLRNGKATSRAPICSGTAKFMSPVTNGIATKKIMIMPCAVKIWS